MSTQAKENTKMATALVAEVEALRKENAELKEIVVKARVRFSPKEWQSLKGLIKENAGFNKSNSIIINGCRYVRDSLIKENAELKEDEQDEVCCVGCSEEVCCVGCSEEVCKFNEEPPHKNNRGEAVCDDCWVEDDD